MRYPIWGRIGKGKWKKPLPFDKVAFPLLRQVMPQLAAKDLVNVQPMTAPTGLMFYLDYQYGVSGALGRFRDKVRDGPDYYLAIGSEAAKRCHLFVGKNVRL